MKKILTAILASVLFLQSAIAVVAAPDISGLSLEVKPDLTLEVKVTNALTWKKTVTISSNQTVSVKATIDMDEVRSAFTTWYNTALAYSGDVAAVQGVPVTGEFYVALEYPKGVTLPDEVFDIDDMSDFNDATNDLFVANGDREYENENAHGNQELKIPFKVKDSVTVGTIYSYTDPADSSLKYFPDMEITVDGVSATTKGAPHKLYGYLNGDVDVAYNGNGWNIDSQIHFEQSEVPEAIIKFGNSNNNNSLNGGGTVTSKNYTLSFESNGGAACNSASYKEGSVITAAMLPVPEREGYTFAGWYLDAELTEKADTITMNKNVTLYAAWTAKEAPGGEYVPEMLNGADHFAYVIGYPDGTIQPNGSITRAEVATIFFRLLKDDIREQYLTYENPYVDVQEGAWYNGAISTLTALGVVNGKDGEILAPNADITRGEFAAIVSRFAEKSAEIAHDFDDVDGHWAEKDIYKAAAFGWIKGYEDNTFRPDMEITRAETMVLINRVLGRVPESTSDLLDDMAKWTDNSNENTWFYIAIQEATNSHDYDRKENGYEAWTKLNENRDWSTYEK